MTVRNEVKEESIGDMIKEQKRESFAMLQEQALVYRERRGARNVEKWGKLYHIYEAARYLSTKDLVNLLLVSKSWRKALKKRVYRIIFERSADKLTINQRRAIWISLLSPVVSFKLS